MLPNVDRREFLRAACAGGALLLAGGLGWQSRPAKTSPQQADAINRIGKLAMGSAIAKYAWLDRGRAPAGYVKGMAVSYAKIYHSLSNGGPAAIEMAKAVSANSDAAKDALKHYEERFRQAGMDNSKAGVDTLRHLFVLMFGLGMRESSGRYCEGRDRSADNTTAETAEAGLFQTSYNARKASPLMPQLFASFQKDPTPSYLEVFKEGVRPKDGELENYGTGDGRDFQKLSKECPFFALSFAAVGLRNIRKHWGPINRQAAEVKTESDEMFMEVQKLVDQDKLGPLL